MAPPVILTIRDPRDSAVSWAPMLGKNIEELIAELSINTSNAVWLADKDKTLTLRYEEGFTSNAEAIGRIAAHLGISVEYPTIIETLKDFLPRTSRRRSQPTWNKENSTLGSRHSFHNETHWHPGHIGDGAVGKYRTLLTSEGNFSGQLSLPDFMKKFCYADTEPATPQLVPGQIVEPCRVYRDLVYINSGFSFPEPSGHNLDRRGGSDNAPTVGRPSARSNRLPIFDAGGKFHEPLRFSIAINGIAAMEHFSTAENDIELVINANDQRLVGNSLDLEFRLENPQSPAECGIKWVPLSKTGNRS